MLFCYLHVVLYGKTTEDQTHTFLDEDFEFTLLDQEISDALESWMVPNDHYVCGGLEELNAVSRML